MILHLYFLQHEPDNPHDTHAVGVKRVQDQEGTEGTLQTNGPCAIDTFTCLPFIFKARRANISGSGW